MAELKKIFQCDSFTLKMIAIITMLIDHIGVIFFPEMISFRIIGRISFPIFAFLIVEGFLHTRDIKKYMIRLGTFALISEIPFDMAFHGTILEFGSQNVFFTLFLGVVLLYFYDQQYNNASKIGCVLLILLAGDIFRTDYGAWGILMIFCFYVFREKRTWQMLSLILINVFAFGLIQAFAALAVIPISMYNGKRGISAKYLFYIIYPLHLLILFLIRIMI